MRVVSLVLLLFIALPAQAADKFLDIQEVTSDRGITAWLVEDPSLPVISLQFRFLESGSALEKSGQQGLVQLLSNTMDEGAGKLTSTDFQKALLDNSITLTFSGGRDGFGGMVKTLSRHKEEAFNLLHLALTAPRFDDEPVQRMKEANLSRIRASLTDPDWMAARLINARAFEGHPYAFNSGGTLSTLPKLTAKDLRAFYKTYLTKDRLIVAVAGDISGEELKGLLDKVFGTLPDKAPEKIPENFIIKNQGTVSLYKRPIPQSIIQIMMPAFGRDNPDYYALQVMNYIFGGAGFGSRLMEEVREKRGLSYGIYSSIQTYRHTDTLSIGVSTKNETAAQTLDVIRAEMKNMVNEPVSDHELSDAKAYLTGSMPLTLSSTDNIASLLLSMREEDLPIGYLDHYADKINAVTARDIQRVAVRLLDPESMTTIIIGSPENIAVTHNIEALPNVE